MDCITKNENIEKFNGGQEIAVWVGRKIDSSSPAFTKALHIQIVDEEEKKNVHSSIPKFVFKQNEFPPVTTGFVTFNGTRYKMTKGNFKWEKGNKIVQTDASSPTQIA